MVTNYITDFQTKNGRLKKDKNVLKIVLLTLALLAIFTLAQIVQADCIEANNITLCD